MKIVILSAGMGTRLEANIPKSLTKITDSKTIMDFQVEKLMSKVSSRNIFVVVGFKKDMIMEKFPNLNYVFNDQFRTTNTSKSVLQALKKIGHEDVLYLDGDVYFDRKVLDLIDYSNSCILVNKKSCKDDETKYSTNKNGFVIEISNSLDNYDGALLGIRFIKKEDVDVFRAALEKADDEEYGDMVLGKLCLTNKIKVKPIFVEDFFCKGINYESDLEEVKNSCLN